MVLNLGHKLILEKNFIGVPFTSPSVAPSVLQLVSESIWSLVDFNRLCNLKATWINVPSSSWGSMHEDFGY
jgi:hypothetical protein